MDLQLLHAEFRWWSVRYSGFNYSLKFYAHDKGNVSDEILTIVFVATPKITRNRGEKDEKENYFFHGYGCLKRWFP